MSRPALDLTGLANRSTTNGPTLRVRGLRTVYGTARGQIVAVRDVAFELASGEAIGIVGESGCGKTAIALTLLGLLPRNGRIAAGEVSLGDEMLLGAGRNSLRSARGRRIAMVFQDSMTSLDPLMPVGRQIAEGMVRHLGMDRSQARARSIELLEEVGVPDPARRLASYPHQLSGGLRQRVAIAVALAANPEVLIADEPTTALDVTIQAQILDLLERERRERGMALILITHDLGVVANVADRMLVMYAGRVVESGATAEIFAHPGHPYTIGLLRSMPRVDTPVERELATIKGSPPSGYRELPGCPFRPRCDWALDACAVEDPPLAPLKADRPAHAVACLADPGVVAR